MSAWQKAVTELAIDSAVNYVGSQISERNVVKQNTPIYQEPDEESYKVYAEAYLRNHQKQNEKSIFQSKIAGVAAGGNLLFPAIIQVTDQVGLTLTADQQLMTLTAINVCVGLLTIWLRKFKTTETIK